MQFQPQLNLQGYIVTLGHTLLRKLIAAANRLFGPEMSLSLEPLGSVFSRCSGMSPRSPPRKTAGRVRWGFVQIDQSEIRLPRLSRRNNYINCLCLHFRIHFTFFTWYLFRTFSGMFCVTDIAFYVLQKLTDFVAKQNHDFLQSAREYS